MDFLTIQQKEQLIRMDEPYLIERVELEALRAKVEAGERRIAEALKATGGDTCLYCGGGAISCHNCCVRKMLEGN